MNKKFQRALSSVLAFIMLCSCICVMNVGSVWAASGDITALATAGTDTSLTAITADSESYLYYYSMPSVSTAADTEISATDSAGNTYTGSVKLTSGTVSFAINGTSLTGQKASSNAGNNVIRGLKAGQTVVFDLYMNAASECTMSFKAGSTAKTSPDTTLDLGSAKAPFQVSVDINTDMDLYFYNNQQLAIANIGVKTSAAAVDGAVTLTETGVENGVTTVTVGGEALVSGTTYAADSAVVISAAPNDGYKATVTVNDKEVELKNNAYSFNVNGDANIAVTYDEVSDKSYGFYDFGGAEGSLVSTADFENAGISNGSNQSAAGTYTFGNLTFVSTDGKARIYWNQSKEVLGTTYTGYFYTNGARTAGNTGRILQIKVNGGDVISVVSSADADNYGIEIYNSTDNTYKYDSGAELASTGTVTNYIAPVEGTYNINVYGQKAYIYRVTVSKPLTVTPNYMVNGSQLTSGTVKVDGTEYSVGDSISALDGAVLAVIYTADDGTTYTGTLTVSADDTTPTVTLEANAVTDISLDFMNGAIITDEGTYYIKNGVASTTASTDYDVKIGTVKTHNSGYGVVGNNFVIELKDVVAPAKITIGTNDYGGTFTAASTGTGEFADAAGVVNTKFSTKGAKYSTSTDNVKTIYYTGTEAATITLTAQGQIYVPYIGVETINAEDIPTLVYGNTGVKITVTGADDGDTVIITDAEKNEYSAVIAGGAADFSDNIVMLGAATVEVPGYTVTGSPITIAADVTDYTVTAELNGEAVPAGSDTAVLYVGYAPTEGYKVYKTVQAAVDAAAEGDTIKIADGEYHEITGVTVNTNNITVESASGDKTKVVIWDNDNEQASNAKGFHGDTLLVNATGFVANNITIMNNAEETGMIPNTSSGSNATALGINSKDAAASASATFNNCSILATRDTVYTGSKNPTSLTLNNCLITGFQDTICGSGTVTLNDCTMNPELGVNGTKFTTSTARVFCPRTYGNNSAVYTANNLTIAAIDGTSTNPIYFARSWDATANTVIINGYNIDSTAATRFNKALDANFYGYSPTGISSSVNTNTFLWLVRKTEDSGNYNTTLALLNETPVNVFQSATAETIDGTEAYRIIGKINSALVSDANANEVGFAVYNSDNSLLGNMSDEKVYTDNDTDYYSVNFATDVDTSKTATIKPYIKYGVYDIEGSTSSTISYTDTAN